LNNSYFLHTATHDKWQQISTKKRAGIAVPLFSIYSKNSIGIGEFPDIKLLIDWCTKTGLSILQLLPLNEVGGDFAPYSSISTFALEPMYLSIENLKHVDNELFNNEITILRKKFKQRKRRVNYKIKVEKLKLLWHIYKSTLTDGITEFEDFKKLNFYWLKDYALYKIIGEQNLHHGWEKWDEKLIQRNAAALNEIEINNFERLQFYYWLQWQLFEQLKDVKKYSSENSVLVMGDLPFLVSRESADVWAHQDYFRLDLSSGAPPDMYFALGQKWGMPPYNWYKIADDSFRYLKEKLKFAENFYNMYRIDHFIGLFRVWTINLISEHEGAMDGSYEPYNENIWEQHGREIINQMVSSTEMLPCAEDLGTVPSCSYKVLYEFGIPGIDFQRYYKNPGSGFNFKMPMEYRINSMAVISTHDSSFFIQWWQFEAGTIDEKLFELMCEKTGMHYAHYREAKKLLFNSKHSKYGRLSWNKEVSSSEILINILKPPQEKINEFTYLYYDTYGERQKFLNHIEYIGDENADISPGIISKNLEKINQANSIFSIQLIQEYLALDEMLLTKMKRWSYRINIPGSVSNKNWSLLLPVSLEEMMEMEINHRIKNILFSTGRAS